jgi:hypothetical protein
MKNIFVLFCLIFISGSLLACPSLSGGGTELNYDSNTLYSPRAHDVIAGGGEDLSLCYDLPGTGWVATNPDFKFTFQNAKPIRELEIRIDGECDTVLLVNDPSGNWFHDDDSNGSLDGLIRFTTAPSGLYDVWVGTYDGKYCDAEVTFESF